MRKYNQNGGYSGREIIFTGTRGGQGTTTCLLLMAAGLAYNGFSVLVTRAVYGEARLEEAVLGRNDPKGIYGFSGMDELVRLFKAGRIGKQEIEACSIKLGERMFLLPGTGSANRETYENQLMENVVRRILRECTQCFDCVLVDAGSAGNRLSLDLYNDADAIVMTVGQDPYDINGLSERGIPQTANMIYVINRYDHRSRFDILKLRYMCGRIRHENTVTVPYCTSLADAMADGSMMRYVKKLAGKRKRPLFRAGGETEILSGAVETAVFLITDRARPVRNEAQTG